MSITESDLDQAREEFYSANRKNLFFRKQEKIACAGAVAEKFKLEDLVRATCFTISETQVFFDYKLFKMYATPENYTDVVQHVIAVMRGAMEAGGGAYEMHLDLASLTISALERYRPALLAFFRECETQNPPPMFSQRVSLVVIYNTPGAIDSIASLLQSCGAVDMRSKTELVSKDNSPTRLAELLSVKN
jgi:hypothetical protein